MPRHYAAIHFHEDDLYDCRWETDFIFDIPAGMASGVYGIRLHRGDIEDIIPVYVLPPAGTATAPIVFLASTFTYQVYGNHQRKSVDDAFRARQSVRCSRPARLPSAAACPAIAMTTTFLACLRTCCGGLPATTTKLVTSAAAVRGTTRP
jgi:hypothetical protein